VYNWTTLRSRAGGVLAAELQARWDWYVVGIEWHPDPLHSLAMFLPHVHSTAVRRKVTQHPRMDSAGLEAFHRHLLLPLLCCHVPRGSGLRLRRAAADTACSVVRSACCSGPYYGYATRRSRDNGRRRRRLGDQSAVVGTHSDGGMLVERVEAQVVMPLDLLAIAIQVLLLMQKCLSSSFYQLLSQTN
jgi:hypothetical protein